jgi:hypothetical protein
MTLPFFGSGIVELPPEGFKRAKNSRKMQMVFFVHEGKVLVTVGPPAVEQNGHGVSGGEAETNEFAISKGGVWVVPRGMFLLFFAFLSLFSSITPHCIAFQPHDRKMRSSRKKPHHATVVDAGFLPSPSIKEERSAISASSSINNRLENSKKSPNPKRCVRPAVGITSASHRNTARACVSLHPRQGLPLSGTVLPSIL